MTEQEELLELIPLLACGALEPHEKARARELLERHPEIHSHHSSYQELDGLLRRTLAPAPALVRRQCPFCKDDLRAAAEVLCAKCLTPHHKECFSENRGCSLLGCHGTRSVSADEPSLDVCPTCGEHTPSEAPFCAWCRTPLGGERAPRHARPIAVAEPPRDLPRFLAACAALLVAGLSIGWFFETRQNVLMDQVLAQGQQLEAQRFLKGAEAALLSLRDAEEIYRRGRGPFAFDSGNFYIEPYAGSMSDLAPIMSASRFEAPGYRIRLVLGQPSTFSGNAFVPLTTDGTPTSTSPIYTGTYVQGYGLPPATITPIYRYAALAVPTNDDERIRWNRLLPSAEEREGLFLDATGAITHVPPSGGRWQDVSIDPNTLSVIRNPGERR
ncbi:MAG TPA: RING finger protein [Planctomycetota bacterium]|nr:RING finger protein [Planctomycetota bacterium]